MVRAFASGAAGLRFNPGRAEENGKKKMDPGRRVMGLLRSKREGPGVRFWGNHIMSSENQITYSEHQIMSSRVYDI